MCGYVNIFKKDVLFYDLADQETIVMPLDWLQYSFPWHELQRALHLRIEMII